MKRKKKVVVVVGDEVVRVALVQWNTQQMRLNEVKLGLIGVPSGALSALSECNRCERQQKVYLTESFGICRMNCAKFVTESEWPLIGRKANSNISKSDCSQSNSTKESER